VSTQSTHCEYSEYPPQASDRTDRAHQRAHRGDACRRERDGVSTQRCARHKWTRGQTANFEAKKPMRGNAALSRQAWAGRRTPRVSPEPQCRERTRATEGVGRSAVQVCVCVWFGACLCVCLARPLARWSVCAFAAVRPCRAFAPVSRRRPAPTEPPAHACNAGGTRGYSQGTRRRIHALLYGQCGCLGHTRTAGTTGDARPAYSYSQGYSEHSHGIL
jgi:hypothetical protein